MPYALSMMSGTSWAAASVIRRRTSSSVRTFPVGLVGRETHIAPVVASTFTSPKSTPYLNVCSSSLSMRGRTAVNNDSVRPTSA